MKFLRATGASATILFGTLFLGPTAPAFGQHDGHGDKPDKHSDNKGDQHGQPDRQGGRQDRGAPQQSAPQAAQPQRSQSQERAAPQQTRQAQPQQTHPEQARPQRAQTPQRQQPQQQRAQEQHVQQQQPQRTQQQAASWQQKRGWLQQGGGWQGRDSWQQNRAQRWSSDHRTWVQRGGYGGLYIPQDRFSLYFGDNHFFRISTRPVMYLGYPRFEYSGVSFMLLDPYPEYWSDNWYDANDLYIDYDDGYYLHNRAYPQVRLAITVAL